MSGTHSILAPSFAPIWAHCPGSVPLGLAYADDTSPEAMEGFEAHSLAAWILEQADRFVGASIDNIRLTIRNAAIQQKIALTDDMLWGAALYVTTVLSVMNRHNLYAGPNVGIEVKIDCCRIHDKCFGTPDAWIWHYPTKTLYIFDFKFGYGVVDVFGNYQLVAYYAGLIDLLNIKQDRSDVIVKFCIVQPRAPHGDGPVRVWETTGDQLNFFIEYLHNQAEFAMEKAPLCEAGTHCRYCPALIDCATAQKNAERWIAFRGTSAWLSHSTEQCGHELTVLGIAIEALQHRYTALETRVEKHLRGGARVPGWGLKQTYGHRVWTIPGDVVNEIGSVNNLELTTEKPVTPAQAERLGLDTELIEAYTKRPDRGLKLKQAREENIRAIFEGGKGKL